MQDNELIEILKEFDEKRVEQLNDNARNLFNAIMSIADERDRLLEENKQLKNNWEKLKKWLNLYIKCANDKKANVLLESVINYIEEIEKSDK